MYNLYSLGWHSFQQLCLTVTRKILGQTVESFLDSNDDARDGAFTGTWTPRSGETLSGRFVLQCKFTSKKDISLHGSDLSDEVEKARRLVEKGLCDVYVLLTNAGIRDVIHTAPERLRWGIWAYSHAAVKTPKGLKFPDGSYICWAQYHDRF